MSVFDPDAFMASTTSDAGSTTFDPIPAGEYACIIDEVKAREVNGRDGPRVVVDVTCLLQAPDVAKQLGREKLSVRTGIFLDLTPNGGLDMAKGKNIGLNRLREACGLNSPGKPFSIQMLKGQTVKAQVTLRPDKNSDAIYNDIKSFGKL